MISNFNDIEVIDHVSIIPTWGIRRNLGKHFNYEAGIGIGHAFLFKNNNGNSSINDVGVLNLHLKIGYKF